MYSRRVISFAVTLLIAALLVGGYVIYRNYMHKQLWQKCDRGDIAACSELIVSGDDEGKVLALAHITRGRLLLEKKDFAKAMTDFDTAIRLYPDSYEAYRNRGVSHFMKGEVDAAIHDFDKAIALVPVEHAAYKNRAIAYVAKHDYPRALRDYDTAIRISPDKGGLYCGRAAVRRATGDIQGSDADAAKAVALGEHSSCILH